MMHKDLFISTIEKIVRRSMMSIYTYNEKENAVL
jgi:hypothetical protein